MKLITVLGSTGSVGTQTLKIVVSNPDKFGVYALSAHSNIALLKQQLKEFKPLYCVITGTNTDINPLDFPSTRILYGAQALMQVSAADEVSTVVAATLGLHSLNAVLAAIKAGKRIAIANKEILVAAGSLVKQLIKEHPAAELIPVDSEHSAIFQCLCASGGKGVKRLILTASGGAFRDTPVSEFENLTAEDALAHPNWSMGKKITVDSATLMNKGLEVIEASWLFDMAVDDIDCVLHRQSIIHSMVEFEDNSVLAQLSYPSMEIPIAYALSYPERIAGSVERLDFCKISGLTFEPCDTEKFPCLSIAYAAAKKGGAAPAIMSSANDWAVERFLRGALRFTQIPQAIEKALIKFDTGIKITNDSVYYIEREVNAYLDDAF